MNLPVFSNIKDAYKRISPLVNRTPVMKSDSINKIAGAEIYFKCENFQKVGAFKYRGASNAVAMLSGEEAMRGVATHSSGNHAQALALAALNQGIPAYIVMPSNSPAVKKKAVEGYGGKITFCEPTLAARESTLDAIVEETGATFIHPYNNFNVIAGQGTAALEFCEDIPKKTEFVIAPVGGGGLLSGTSITVKELSPDTKVHGAEPKGADDAYRSFISGEIIPSEKPDTICDGLLTSLGDMTFEIINKNVSRIVTADDESIIAAMKLIWERMKIVVEPSSAVPLAVVLNNPSIYRGSVIGIIISGGNVDLKKLPF